jgi:hypothetical protein
MKTAKYFNLENLLEGEQNDQQPYLAWDKATVLLAHDWCCD